MKVSTENDNNCGYEKITILVDNIPLRYMIQWWRVTKLNKTIKTCHHNGFIMVHD